MATFVSIDYAKERKISSYSMPPRKELAIIEDMELSFGGERKSEWSL